MIVASKPARLTSIEAARGLAATAVVLYHVARHLDKAYGLPGLMSLFQFGHAGVDLFFVISGFIILFVHFEDIGRPGHLSHYLSRRFTRILPIYWVALGVTVALSVTGGHHLPSLPAFAWSAFLLPSHAEPLLGVAWTLQYEVVFYAAFCVLIVDRRAGLLLLLAWLAGIVLGQMGVGGFGAPPSLAGLYNLEFFLGMLAALYLRHRGLPTPRLVLAAGVVLFAAAAWAEDTGRLNGYADLGRLAYGVPAALIVLGAAAASRAGLIVVPAPLRVLGAASYSIYLFQFMFIGAAWKFWLGAGLDRDMPPLAAFPLLVLCGLGGGLLMSRTVEYPLMRLIRGRRRPAQLGPATG